MMMMIMMILVLLGMAVTGFEAVVGVARRVMVAGVSLFVA